MTNVVALRRPRPIQPPAPEVPVNTPHAEAKDFIVNYLYPWALDQGIDLEGFDFKFESATIMTVVQGMLHRVKND